MDQVTYSLAETETTISQTAEDHSKWRFYTADPYWIRRMEAIDAKLLREYDDGIGRLYELRADQLSFRKGKRQLSEKTKAAMAERMRTMRQTQAVRSADG